jgi:small nuclear ribonucleoprotein (snRNP)-like protein
MLYEYLSKNVKVTKTSGKVIIGEVVSYSFALQNKEMFELEEQDSFSVKQDGYNELIYENEIVGIEILQCDSSETSVLIESNNDEFPKNQTPVYAFAE